jgi:hypothetical protein
MAPILYVRFVEVPRVVYLPLNGADILVREINDDAQVDGNGGTQ